MQTRKDNYSAPADCNNTSTSVNSLWGKCVLTKTQLSSVQQFLKAVHSRLIAATAPPQITCAFTALIEAARRTR